MALTSEESRVSYQGSGTTGPFPVTYEVFAAEDLNVWLLDTATGVITELTQNVDYTVATPNFDSVTTTAPVPVGTTIYIDRNPAVTQPIDFTTAGRLRESVLEDALDRIVMLVQSVYNRASELVTNTLRVGKGQQVSEFGFDRENKIAGFGADKDSKLWTPDEIVGASSGVPNGVGVPAGGTTGQVLTKTADTDFAQDWQDASGANSGDPTNINGVLHGNGSVLAPAVKGAEVAHLFFDDFRGKEDTTDPDSFGTTYDGKPYSYEGSNPTPARVENGAFTMVDNQSGNIYLKPGATDGAGFPCEYSTFSIGWIKRDGADSAGATFLIRSGGSTFVGMLHCNFGPETFWVEVWPDGTAPNRVQICRCNFRQELIRDGREYTFSLEYVGNNRIRVICPPEVGELDVVQGSASTYKNTFVCQDPSIGPAQPNAYPVLQIIQGADPIQTTHWYSYGFSTRTYAPFLKASLERDLTQDRGWDQPHPVILYNNGAIRSASSVGLNVVDTFTIPGGRLGPNGFVRISGLYRVKAASTAGSRQFQLHFGGSNIKYIINVADQNLTNSFDLIVHNRGVENAQIMSQTPNDGRYYWDTVANPDAGGAPGILQLAVNTALDTNVDVRFVTTDASDLMELDILTISAFFKA